MYDVAKLQQLRLCAAGISQASGRVRRDGGGNTTRHGTGTSA